MRIVEDDFIMEPADEVSSRYNIRFSKKVKKRATGEYAIEFGDPLYGMTLSSCLNLIAHHRTAKKFEEKNVTLKEFLVEFNKNYKVLLKLCKESLPENLDTGG